MPLKIGASDISNVCIGESAVDAVMLNGEAVYRRKQQTVYGWHIDPSDTDPAVSVTYLVDAVGKTPAAMGASLFSYGDWADAFFMPKPCMLRSDGTVDYYLNPDDYRLKENAEALSASVATTIQGNVYDTSGIGSKIGHNDADNRCRTERIEIAPRTAAKFMTNSPNIKIALYMANSSDVCTWRTIGGGKSTAVCRNYSDQTFYVYASFSRTDPNAKLAPADFIVHENVYDISDVSDVANASYDGNAMMEWPLIWYKFEEGEADGEGYFYCSNEQIDDTFHCWCNVNSENEITEHFYTAIYNGTGKNKMRSLSEVLFDSNSGVSSTSFTQEQSLAAANDTTNIPEWTISTWCDHQLISALLVLLGKSTDTQTIYGKGCVGTASTLQSSTASGACDDKGLFSGSQENWTTPVKVFGMENYWGIVYRRIAGLIGSSSGCYYKLTYGTADGSSATGYNYTGLGYHWAPVSTTPSTGAFITKMKYGSFGFIPIAGGSSVTGYSDGYGGGNYGLMTGGISCNQAGGTFMMHFEIGDSGAWYVGASLSCKPVKK